MRTLSWKHKLLERAGWRAQPADDGWLIRRTDVPEARVSTFETESGVRASRVLPGGRLTQLQRHELELDELKTIGEEHLVWLMSRIGVNVVLDVGANTGQFARRLRNAGYKGWIVSFEPVKEFADVIEELAAEDPRWHLRRYALGDEQATVQINRAGTMSSMLESSDFGKNWKPDLLGEGEGREEIRIERLDEVWDDVVTGPKRRPKVFLKLDTQGFDLRVVRGAGARLPDILGLQSELSCLPIYEGMPHLTEQLSEYEADGFAITGIFPVTRHVRSMRMIEFDVVMVRSEGRDQSAATAPHDRVPQPAPPVADEPGVHQLTGQRSEES